MNKRKLGAESMSNDARVRLFSVSLWHHFGHMGKAVFSRIVLLCVTKIA